MAPKIATLSLALVACVVVTFGLLTLVTPRAAEAQYSGMAKGVAGEQTASVTGCVQKGVEAGGFYLNADDGKVWELSGRDVKLGKLVGDTATVMGRELHRSKAAEAKLETDEMKEAAGKAYGDFQVTSVKSVSHGCGG